MASSVAWPIVFSSVSAWKRSFATAGSASKNCLACGRADPDPGPGFLPRDPRDISFDLLYLGNDLRGRRLQRLRLAKEIFGSAELPLGHHDRAKLQEGGRLVLLVRQALADGIPDIALGLFDIVLLHREHPHL